MTVLQRICFISAKDFDEKKEKNTACRIINYCYRFGNFFSYKSSLFTQGTHRMIMTHTKVFYEPQRDFSFAYK